MPDPLDEDFPLGDGTVELSADSVCPYCGEPVTLALDPGGGARQTYVEDCSVCCRPWVVTVSWNAAGEATAELAREDGE